MHNSTNHDADETFYEETNDGYPNSANGNNSMVVERSLDNYRPQIDEEQQARIEQIDANLREVLLRGQKVVFDGDLEYIHLPDQELQPMEATYETKANDALCGNIAFKCIVCILFILCTIVD